MPGMLAGQPFGVEQYASRYPFSDISSLTTKDGLSFSSAWVLDARLYPVGSVAGVCLTSIAITGGLVVITVGDPVTTVLATTSFAVNTTPTPRMPLSDPDGRLCGLLLVDPVGLSSLSSWPAGTHKFNPGAAEFAASTVVPRPEIGLRSIKVPGFPLMSGLIWIAGGPGVTLQASGQSIIFNVVGDPLFVQRSCGTSGFVAPVVLRTINNQGPDGSGNFLFWVVDPDGTGTILRISQQGTTVQFSLAGAAASIASP